MLSLYIHIPFCVQKCPYCGFYSTPYSARIADEFIDAVESEAKRVSADFFQRTFNLLYIGGGTPTILNREQFERLISIIKKYFKVLTDAEFTIEANPNTVTSDKLTLYLEHGVNRLSLGVQSFSDSVLQVLGRLHTAEQAAEAFKLARSSGFVNIGIDLIYGITGQTKAQWEETLNRGLELKPEHVSTYSLSLDEGSRFSRESVAGGFSLPDEELVAEMYERTLGKMRDAGYDHYEISNFSLPGFECKHNMNYWKRGEYLGLGPGAWSFIAEQRYSNIADVVEYSQRLSSNRTAIDCRETVGPGSAAAETVMLRLRTMHGLDLGGFGRECGPDLLRSLEKSAVPLVEAGLLQITEGRLRLTDRGILLSDEALARLSA